MFTYGKWLVKGENLDKLHPFPIYLICELEKIFTGYDFPWIEIIIEDRNFLEIKNQIPVIHISPDRSRSNLELLKDKLYKLWKWRAKIPQDSKKVEKPASVLLLFPYSLKDKRWKSIGIPTSLLFLSYSLKAHFHLVEIRKINIEADILPEEMENFSWIGITLYDDLFPQISKLIKIIKGKYKGKIAVGGPMVTLSPIAVSAHLPEANLMMRGEAEESFPKVLSLLSEPLTNLSELFKIKGFLYRDENILIFSSLSYISLPDLRFSNIDVNAIPEDELEKGLEINTSRGCPRGCIYCSHVHGKTLRKIPSSNVKLWLENFKKRLREKKITNPSAFTVNINDDDILLDVDRAKEIIKIINESGLKLWGIQSSLETINKKRELLDFIACKDFYFGNRPLLWLGTDSFLPSRRKRLGRKPLDEKTIEILIKMMEEREISNFHYLILTDFQTEWEEFIEELFFIFHLQEKYDFFEIMATSKFLIPYPYTPSFKITPEFKIEKEILSIINFPQFDYPLVKFVKPKNERILDFLDAVPRSEVSFKDNFSASLSKRNFREAINMLYYFLKTELQNEKDKSKRDNLAKIVEKIEEKASLFHL